MQESKLRTTPADIQRALVESLALDGPAPSTDEDHDAPAADDEAQGRDGYGDGDLPEFSDEEPEPQPAQQQQPSSSRLVPGKGRPKGKLPLSALKNRIQVGASIAKKAAKAQSAPAPAAAAPVASSSSSAPSTVTAQDKGKGKGKALKFSGKQLDSVAARILKDHPELEGKLGRQEVQEILDMMQIDKDVLNGEKGLMGKGTKSMGGHKFWRTQPVPQLDEKEEEVREGPLEADKKPEDVQQEPVKLHKDFKWVTVNLSDEAEKKEVYDLLTHHYVEDLDASFRFDYSPEFIEWALKPPGYVPDWHVGIRVAETGKLVGFISGVPMDLRIRNATKRVTEINYLCVHKKLRTKRLAPLLIQEVTRRTHLRGIFQAIYTSGTFLPTPFSRCQYYHRNLNPAKLVKLGFSAVPRNSTVARMVSQYRVPSETSIPGLRELEKRDLKQASRLLRAYSARFDVAPMLSNKDVEHALWNGRGKDVNGKREGQVTWSYVVEDPETHRITDVFGFYHLPSTAIKASPPARIEAAYLYYYATTAAPSCADLGDGSVAVPVQNWKDESPEERKVLADRLKALVGDAMTLVTRAGFDVLNALTIQDNSLFIEDLKFGKGDGFLHFYLYNYATKPVLGGIDPSDGGSGVGVIMLSFCAI
ncbi:glycylpeptide N-tetradecanoyltransferase [Rhodotorula kratochvilovae]